VIAPASTGRDNNRRIAVTSTDQANKGIRSINSPIARKFPNVLIKFTAPIRDDTPARCKEKIAKSTDAPAWDRFPLKGGYTVHPVPAPDSTRALDRSNVRAGIKNQKLKLFNRGNAISGAPNIIGTNQFPKPPIKTGITIKKIIIKACAVTTTLYTWSSPIKDPAWPSSKRINILSPVPIMPAHAPIIRYKVPISL